MKAQGELPRYFDGGAGMNFPLTIPPCVLWICSLCGEVAATTQASHQTSKYPPKWNKIRLTEAECKKRGIPYEKDSAQYVLLLCTDCQDEEGKELKEKTEDASSD